MADIVIAALGSHGDVAPLTGVGVRLQQAGHRVTLTAYERFASLVRNCGIGFRGVFEPRESSDEADVDVTRALFQFLAPQGMRSLGTALLTALQDTPADILLLSPFSELAGHPLAEAKGIPSAGIRFQPYSATADFPPATLGGWSAGPTGNRLASRAGAELIDRLYGGVTAGFRRDFGLPKVSARRLREQRTKAGWTVLHGFSPHIVPRPTGWRPGLEICGYWWPQTDPQWRPLPHLSISSGQARHRYTWDSAAQWPLPSSQSTYRNSSGAHYVGPGCGASCKQAGQESMSAMRPPSP